MNGALIPAVNVVTGGSPCQDLSIAGNRNGLAGERSALVLDQIRIIKEMRDEDIRNGRSREDARPRYMVWENVTGALNSNRGADFGCVLQAIIEVVQPEAPVVPQPKKGWPNAGCLVDGVGGQWSIAWRVHDAQFWGVPQRRRRIAIVCDFGGLTAPEVLFERKSMPWNIDESRTPRQDVTAGTGNGAEESSQAISFCQRAGKPGNGKGILIQYERGDTLSTANNQRVFDARGNGNGEVVCTLTGDHQNRVTDYTALIMRQRAFGDYAPDDVVSAIKARDHKDATDLVVAAVDCRNGTENYEVNGTLQAKESGGTSLNLNNVCRIDSTVRRLTPLECERLQGYPDGWTDIGEWVDSKGKKHKIADTPRYKALGNSIALPFWAWLLQRISLHCGESATLGSLFDGIGGFPLIWELINGRGSCLWASEIEEFPIAVTKFHFGAV